MKDIVSEYNLLKSKEKGYPLTRRKYLVDIVTHEDTDSPTVMELIYTICGNTDYDLDEILSKMEPIHENGNKYTINLYNLVYVPEDVMTQVLFYGDEGERHFGGIYQRSNLLNPDGSRLENPAVEEDAFCNSRCVECGGEFGYNVYVGRAYNHLCSLDCAEAWHLKEFGEPADKTNWPFTFGFDKEVE